MKLYYTNGACSLASNIALREAAQDFELVRVDLSSHTTETGDNYYEINPKGYVPALKLPDGSILTEGVAILQYVADLNKESNLAPASGTMERYRLQEWLTFISSEIHKGFSPLFNPAISESDAVMVKEKLNKRFPLLESALSQKTFLMGENFTVADSYLFTILNWAQKFNMNFGSYPHIQKFMDTVKNRPKVQDALHSEGLI